MAQAGGRVTVRVNTGSLSFRTAGGRRFDLLGKVGEVSKTGDVRAWPVQVAAPQGLLVPGRVCALRKTEEATEIAQEGIRKQARKVRPETLEFAKFVIVFTTLGEEGYPAEEVLELYRLRWQVELVFRRFKSLAQLGHLPKQDDESAKAWLYGKLLVALLVEKLISHALAVSPWGYRLGAHPSPQRFEGLQVHVEPSRAGR